MTNHTQPGDIGGAVAIVTGSGRNIGRAIALTLAEAGATVVVNTRRSGEAIHAVANDIRQAGGQALPYLADVTDPDQVEDLIQTTLREFGRLDILVNNVADRLDSPIHEMSLEDWHRILGSILDATFLCTRAAAPHLGLHGPGSIVNIGGVAGHTGLANRAAVSTAKAGIAGFTRAMAVELAPRNITVNCVSPGYVDTVRDGPLPSHFANNSVPAGRPGRPDEIAATVGFLCGPGARYISGQTIHVNGAWHSS